MSKITIEFTPMEIEMEEGERLESGIRAMVREAVKEEARRLFDDQLKQSIQRTLDSLCKERATSLIDELLAGDWQPLTTYGSPSGPPIPMKDYLLQQTTLALKAKEGTYSDSKPLLEGSIARAVKGFLDKEIADEVNKAKAQIKQSMEKGIAAMIRTAAQDIVAGKFGS